MRQRLPILFLLLIVVALATFTASSGAAGGPLKYTLSYKGYPSPGATILLIHNFTADWSTYDIMINSFTVATKWSFLNATGAYHMPLIVGWPGSKLVNTSLQIPAVTAFGTYPVNIWVNWDYQTIFSGWQPGQDLILNTTLQVIPYAPPSFLPARLPSLPTWTLSAIIFYLAAATFVTVVVARREKKRGHEITRSQNRPS